MDELLGLFEHLFDSVSQLGNLLYERTTTNVAGTFKSMTPKQYIRLVMIVGAYMLFRKYVIMHGAKFQQRQMEKREAEEKAEEEKRNAEMSPNDLRGAAGVPEDTDSEGEEAADASGAVLQFGKKARRRQRNAIKKLLDAEEERLRQLQEDEEDKDIQEFLNQ
ncbi:protein trafficking Pga2 [Microdochium bolleyi]|uniref:Protein trafficking Pga2 n=1 Tax=Microdochium bolleyi TaxID=196109 RepID=A0A136J6N0_9PEZI|nr:protein trafficking Pga2 [Microdochium bolleyi]